MEWNVSMSGGGYAKIPKRNHVASFTIETSNLLQGDSLRIRLISVPDTIFPHREYSDKIFWWISGEVRVFQEKVLECQKFTVPLFFDYEKRIFETGAIHKITGENNRYINLHRGY